MYKAVSFLLMLFSFTAHSELKCDVDLNYGMVVNERHIRILDESRTVYQINDANQLIVKGEWLELTSEQQEKLYKLANGIHYVVPKMITLATEGVELAVGTIDHVYVGLVGADHKTYEKIQNSLKRAKKKIREKFVHAGHNFYIGPGSLENVDDFVDRELEEQLEQAINTSLGGVLSAIGGLSSGGDAETERQIQDLSERIEVMGQEYERKFGSQSDSLRMKAKWFCNKIHYLNEVEEDLRESIPELKKFNVIITQDHKVH